MAERLSAIATALDAFDADLAAYPLSRSRDVDLGRLRGVVRVLLPMALEDPAFDVTVTVGPAGTAVRVHHIAGGGPTARLVVERDGDRGADRGGDRGADRAGGRHRHTRGESPAEPAPQRPADPGPPRATAARALADLLRQGGRQGGLGTS